MRNEIRSALAIAIVGLRLNGFDAYKVTEHSSTHVDEIVVENALASAPNGGILRVEKLSGTRASDSENFIKERIFKIQSIYEPHIDPYFAAITKKTYCPAEFLPEYTDDKTLHTILLYANERLTYGACTKDTAKYRGMVALLYCPEAKNLFVLENFVPMAIFTPADLKRVRSVQCL